MAEPPQRILLFGGTFDPPHRAHVDLPVRVAEQLKCQRILYIPTGTSPFKTDAPPTSRRHRLAMLRLAIRYIPNAEISTVELDRRGVSYFIDTLRSLRERFMDDAELYFLIGCDQALEFHKWKDWREILAGATPAVMLRPPWNRESFRAALDEIYDAEEIARWMGWIVATPKLDVSSTDIRSRLASGGGTVELLDDEVARYIAEHKLYV